jgi:signal transduction histidine kinase
VAASSAWSRTSALCATLTALVAGSVMAGWIAEFTPLLQFRPSWAPMQFNAALSFLCLSLALLAALRGARRLSLLLGISVLALALATWLQYFLATDFGIDQVFLRPTLVWVPEFPGRMAPITAIGLMILCSSLILAEIPLHFRHFSTVSAIPATCGIVIGGALLWDYVLRWSRPDEVGGLQDKFALQTALCFLLAGLAVLLLLRHRRSGPLGRSGLIPFALSMGILVMSVFFWNLFTQNQATRIRTLTGSYAHSAADNIRVFLEDRSRVLRRLGELPDVAFSSSLEKFFEDFPDVAAVFVRGRRQPLRSELTPDELKRLPDDFGGIDELISLSPTRDFLALRAEQGSGRALVALFDFQALLRRLPSPRDYGYDIRVAGRELLGSSVAPTRWGREQSVVHHFRFRDDTWTVSVSPTIASLRDQVGTFPVLILLAGLALAMLFALTASLFLEAREARRVAEQALVQQKAQEALLVASSKFAALGEMAGGIAHEINNPLAILSGRAQYLRILCDEDRMDAEVFAKHLDSIDSTVERVAKIVRGLRSFARDSSEDDFVHFPVRKLLEETLTFCQDRFRHHEIDLRVNFGAPDLTIHARPYQISQVLLNLLNNAFDATSHLPRGSKRVDIQAVENNSGIEIRVTDSGQGVPEAMRARIFEPFFTTKSPGQGTGLGLAIARGLLAEHGGTLGLDDSSSSTAFVIWLPTPPPVT